MRLRVGVALASVVAGAVFVGAQSGQPPQPVKLALDLRGQRPVAGAKFDLFLTVSPDPGWHVYATSQGTDGPQAMKITLPSAQAFTMAGTIVEPQPKRIADPAFGNRQTSYFDASTTLTIPVQIAPLTASRWHAVKVSVEFQACNDRLCLPPTTEVLSRDVFVLQPSAVVEALDKAQRSPDPAARLILLESLRANGANVDKDILIALVRDFPQRIDAITSTFDRIVKSLPSESERGGIVYLDALVESGALADRKSVV